MNKLRTLYRKYILFPLLIRYGDKSRQSKFVETTYKGIPILSNEFIPKGELWAFNERHGILTVINIDKLTIKKFDLNEQKTEEIIKAEVARAT